MAIGSGLAASIGFAAESTYGTYVAPTRFLEYIKADLKKKKNVVQGGGLAAGRIAQLGSRRVVTSESVEGGFELEVANKGMGLLLAHLLGSSATPVQQGATAAYLQAHTVGDNIGKSLTIQHGVPDLTGTVRPFTFKGCKLSGAEFSCKVGELLTMSLDVDGRQASEVETLVAASLATGVAPFHWAQMSVKLGTFGAEAAVSGVKGFSVKFDRGMASERFYAGAGGLKAEPIMNDFLKVSGSIEVDLVNKADFADRFAADSATSLVIEFVGPLIASTYYQTFRFTLPMVFFDGDTPTVDGPDVTSGGYPFVAQLDGTNPLVSIDYISTDTTL
ncbi:MAG: hypothetical protein IPJ48_18220 [Propionivibrio sp.]|uniref:Uncharacterized protein n=1 Tax=Candidatus Propionivibrio dominans TaxID=2954373 RepID=A0A9D7FA31_9RHOO|nr:hypothetical protein [Candidatus Propionivibrio dominans]